MTNFSVQLINETLHWNAICGIVCTERGRFFLRMMTKGG
jgi:hypothetical protein